MCSEEFNKKKSGDEKGGIYFQNTVHKDKILLYCFTAHSYLANAKRVSKIFNDNPVKHLDTAVYWIEFVTRHGGAFHLRTVSNDLYWFQYYLLDVTAIVSLVSFVMTYSVFKLFMCGCQKSNSKNKTNKIQTCMYIFIHKSRR